MKSILAAAALLVASIGSASAQHGQPGTPAQGAPRVGLLCYLACPNAATKILTDELAALGYVPGQNVVFEYRHADGKPEKFEQAVQELLGQKVDLIFSPTTPGTRTAQRLTTEVPIVFSGGVDPVAMGLVKSMERPGGNLTGVTEEPPEAATQRVALLKEVLPQAKKIGILWDVASYGDKISREMVASTERAIRAAGMEPVSVEVKGPAAIDDGFKSLVGAGVDGLLLEPSNMLCVSEAGRVAELAARTKIPTLWPAVLQPTIQAGGLILIGADLRDAFRRAASQVDKILKGSKPSELPVMYTQKFVLVINKKTASALGLAIPPSLLARADRVIE
jgi:putative ABC transport system substrate-binding protein